MSYFFSGAKLTTGQTVVIQGEEATHVLGPRRVKVGEQLNLQGPDGNRFKAKVTQVQKRELTAKILDSVTVPAEPKMTLALFQSVVNEKALDFILQKGTELGLNHLVLFNSQNTAHKLKPQEFNRKRERWQKIILEAAKQCDRGTWPDLAFAPESSGLFSGLLKYDKIFLCDMAGRRITESLLSPSPSSAALIVGPEGGFTAGEIEGFKASPKAFLLDLGPVLLRAETASLAGMAVLRHLCP